MKPRLRHLAAALTLTAAATTGILTTSLHGAGDSSWGAPTTTVPADDDTLPTAPDDTSVFTPLDTAWG